MCKVRPWLAIWQKVLKPMDAISGVGYENHEAWLFVAWTFGDKTTFQMMTTSMVWRFRVDENGRLVHGGAKVVDGHVRRGHNLVNDSLMPAGLLSS